MKNLLVAIVAIATISAFGRDLPILNGRLEGDLNANGHMVMNLAPPTATNDAATKGYVDAATNGIVVPTSWNAQSNTLDGVRRLDDMAVRTNAVTYSEWTWTSTNADLQASLIENNVVPVYIEDIGIEGHWIVAPMEANQWEVQDSYLSGVDSTAVVFPWWNPSFGIYDATATRTITTNIVVIDRIATTSDVNAAIASMPAPNTLGGGVITNENATIYALTRIMSGIWVWQRGAFAADYSPAAHAFECNVTGEFINTSGVSPGILFSLGGYQWIIDPATSNLTKYAAPTILTNAAVHVDTNGVAISASADKVKIGEQTLPAIIDARIPPAPDLTPYETKEDAAAKYAPRTIYQFVSGSNVYFCITNYYQQTDELPSMSLFEIRDGATNRVWSEKANLTNLEEKVHQWHDAHTPDPAWGTRTAKNGIEAPPDTTWIDTSNIVIASGIQYAKYSFESGHSYWFLRGNGAFDISSPNTTNSFFTIRDQNGKEFVKIHKTAALIEPVRCNNGEYAGITGVTVGNADRVTLTYALGFDNCPAVKGAPRPMRDQDMPDLDPSILVSTNAPTATTGWQVVLDIPHALQDQVGTYFFYSEITKPGEETVEMSAPITMSGGVKSVEGTTIYPHYNNGVITWTTQR